MQRHQDTVVMRKKKKTQNLIRNIFSPCHGPLLFLLSKLLDQHKLRKTPDWAGCPTALWGCCTTAVAQPCLLLAQLQQHLEPSEAFSITQPLAVLPGDSLHSQQGKSLITWLGWLLTALHWQSWGEARETGLAMEHGPVCVLRTNARIWRVWKKLEKYSSLTSR